MVTMDSDSASQDSDDGRRFRFEATRKDSNSRVESGRERASSPVRQSCSSSRRRSRSREHHRSDDRHRENREEASRSRLEYRKWRESRDRSNGPRDNLKYARSHERSSTRDVSPKCDRRDSRGRENKRYHDRSSQDKRETSEKREKFRDSGRSSREANSQSRTRDITSRKKTSKSNAEPEVDKRESWERKEPSHVSRDCENLNLSDFDVVSDTEEHSSDASPMRRDLVGESLKKRVSRQHYERLVKRQETLKRRRGRDESMSPRARNGSGVGATSGPRCDEAPRRSPETSAPSVRSNLPVDKLNEAKDAHWGPVLPPKSLDKMAARSREHQKSESPRMVGPKLPENFRTFDSEEEDDAFGPALPPHFSARDDPNKSKQTSSFSDDEIIGVEEPTSGSGDSDLVGPLPIDHPGIESDEVQQRLEMRARRLKAELAECDKEDEKKREEWMMELPPVKGPSLGLAPRKFRTREGPDMSDRSSWTDTPVDRARKRMEKLENKSACEQSMRDEKRTSGSSVQVEKSRKREKSLLEIHQKKLHKKKKKEEKEAKRNGNKPERRPFDRDIDLQANRFDEARKKSMFLKTAGHLDDRFSRGNI